MSGIARWEPDYQSNDEEYFYLDVNNATIQVKQSEEGLVVDVLPRAVGGVAATLSVTWDEIAESAEGES